VHRQLIYAVAAALLANTAPALTQDHSPTTDPAVASSPWSDPQTPQGPRSEIDSRRQVDGPDGTGAPFARPLPPEAYPARPPAGVAGYPSGYGYGGSSCSCTGYAYPAVAWVPVPIETRYRFSAPIRHESEIVEEKIVEEQVTSQVPVSPKHVKRARQTKGKVVRATK